MFTTALYALAMLNFAYGNAAVGSLCVTAGNLRVIFRK